MKLIVEETSMSDPVMLVRWCLTKPEIDEIREKAEGGAFILIVTTRGDRETSRALVPLEKMADYVHFSQSGENRVQAIVVWSEYGRDSVRQFFLDCRRRGVYTNNVVELGTGNIRNDLDRNMVVSRARAELNVKISPEFFAKKPNRFEEWWVNLFFHSDPVDQCAFRKRRIPAYMLQPLLVAVFLVWKVLICFLMTVLGTILAVPWNVKDLWVLFAKTVRHPFRWRIKHIWRWFDDTAKPMFIVDRTGRVRRSIFIQLFLPLWLLLDMVANSIVYLALRTMELYPDFGNTLVIGLITYVVLGFLVASIYKVWQSRLDRVFDDWREKEREREELERKRRLGLLACDIAGKARLDEIPAELRTVHLRFQGLKKGVCRPYAQ